jgi:2-phosphosulfolactate phosphatase
MTFDQAEFNTRCEWGEHGIASLAPISDVVIIVDVLSFSTRVDIAVSQATMVFPYRWKDKSAVHFAASIGAELVCGDRGETVYSLSPASLTSLPHGARLVLPSPNGAALTFGTGTTPTITGCLRNGRAVAAAAQRYGHRIEVIPADERWRDGSLRPAFEDWVGAGAILSHLPGVLSPEACAAVAAYHNVSPDLAALLKRCGSGKQLIERGFEYDVVLASVLDVSTGCQRVRAHAGEWRICPYRSLTRACGRPLLSGVPSVAWGWVWYDSPRRDGRQRR